MSTRYIIGINTTENAWVDLFKDNTEDDAVFLYNEHYGNHSVKYLCFDVAQFTELVREAHRKKLLPYNQDGIWQIAKEMDDLVKKFNTNYGIETNKILDYAQRFRYFLNQVSVVSVNMKFDDIVKSQVGGRDWYADWWKLCDTSFGTMAMVKGNGIVRIGEASKSFVVCDGAHVIAHRSGERGRADCGIINGLDRFTNCEFTCTDRGRKGKETAFGILYSDTTGLPYFTNCNMACCDFKFLTACVEAGFVNCDLTGATVRPVDKKLFDNSTAIPKVILTGCAVTLMKLLSVDVELSNYTGDITINRIDGVSPTITPHITLLTPPNNTCINTGDLIMSVDVVCEYDNPKIPLKINVGVQSDMTATSVKFGIIQNNYWSEYETMSLEITGTKNIRTTRGYFPVQMATNSRPISMKTDADVTDVRFTSDGLSTSHIVNGDSETPRMITELFMNYDLTPQFIRGDMIRTVVASVASITDWTEKVRVASKFVKFRRLFMPYHKYADLRQ